MTLTPSAQPQAIECETAVRRLWDYVDGRLPRVAFDEVRAHLSTCSPCTSCFAFARAMKDSLGELGSAEALSELDVEGHRALNARIRDALRRA